MLLKIADETSAGGDPATAASLYRQVHEQKPKDPVPLQRLGAIFMTLRDYHSAADAYREAVALDPNNGNLRRELATALLVMGDAQNAMTEIRAALAKQADDPRLYNLLGVAQDMAGRHDLAQQTYRHGTEMAPANVGLRNNYAMSLAMAGDFADAVAELDQIAKPDAPPRYRLNLALAYGLAGDDVHAAEAARQVLDEASVQNNLSYYALLRGMDETHRTAAIIGAELHGTPVVADAALKSKTGSAVADAKPVAAPTPASVTTAALPPLLPEAALMPQVDAARMATAPQVAEADAPQAAPRPPKPIAPCRRRGRGSQAADCRLSLPAPRHRAACSRIVDGEALPHRSPKRPARRLRRRQSLPRMRRRVHRPRRFLPPPRRPNRRASRRSASSHRHPHRPSLAKDAAAAAGLRAADRCRAHARQGERSCAAGRSAAGRGRAKKRGRPRLIERDRTVFRHRGRRQRCSARRGARRPHHGCAGQ